jgi:PPOX class probable F420-dependent enzyme
MSIIPESHLDILQSTTLAHVATVGPKGEPQVSPVWFVWDGAHILFSMNKIRQKYRNLVREPRIALSLVDPANPYRSIEIRGKVRIDKDVNYHFVNSVVTKKYTNQEYNDQNPNPNLEPGEERVVVAVEPERVVVFPFKQKKSK